jgi:two-component system alkaline phosphatase synthesis response regulator PhoP/two-component system response regulator ResD
LVARVKAVLRRAGPASAKGARPLTLGGLVIDPARREATVNGRPLALRAKEFDLLYALAEHKGVVLSREQLLSLVWGYDFYGETRTVDVHIAHLRQRLADTGITIETVWGVGYKLVV